MAKRKKTIISGPIIETAVYSVANPRDDARTRAAKTRLTTAAQKAMNEKSARKRLGRIIPTNFTGRDLFLTLTYRDEDLPRNRKEARAKLRRFLRTLREQRRKRGQALKYIYVTEDKHGEGRLHHHLIINATEDDIETFRSLWTWGDVVDIQYLSKKDIDAWALYMTKEAGDRPNGAQMWTASRNLKRPITRSCYVPNDETVEIPTGAVIIDSEEIRTIGGSYKYIKYRLTAGSSWTPELFTREEKTGRLEPPGWRSE